jgi:hypothetical protein
MKTEVFWERTKTNLQAGRIRLIWVSDVIPTELRRIIEFLNEQMDPAQAIGIEVKMFTGQGLKTMVPRVINPTTQPRMISSPGKKWTEEEYFRTFVEKNSPELASIAKTILDWARENALKIYWGKGRMDGSFVPGIRIQDEEYYPVIFSTNGSIGIQFNVLKTRLAFRNDTQRKELLRRLNSINGIYLPSDVIDRSPSIPFSSLKNIDALNQFISVLDWLFEEIKQAPRIQNQNIT